MTKAFVAGATGLTGREVVRVLRGQGIETVAHVRPDSSKLADWTQTFEALGARVDTSAWTPEAMAATMEIEKPTLVFSLLGTTRKRQSRSDDPAANSYEAVDYGLSHLLLEAAARAGSPRFVYLSSVGADKPRGPYLDVRKRIEDELRAGSLPWTSVRPAIIHGDRDDTRPGEALGKVMGDAFFAVAGALGAGTFRDKWRSIHASDLAAAIVRHALDPASENRAFTAEALR